MTFYNDQHLAWQQRIFKEINAASKFFNHFPVSSKLSRTTSSITTKSKPNPPVLVKPLRMPEVIIPGVYNEVRGKYSRPPPPLNIYNQATTLPTQENFLLVRPSTAGTLKSRSASQNNIKFSRKKTPQSPVFRKPKIFKYSSINNEETQERPEGLIERVKKEIKDAKLSEKGEDQLKVDADENEKEEEGDKEKENSEDAKEDEDRESGEGERNNEETGSVLEGSLRDDRSYKSGLTTSSHKRYILELESMLRKEKLRRYQLEESLKKVKKSEISHSIN